MTIYLQFSDCGQHIRKWSREPFEGGAAFTQEPERAPGGLAERARDLYAYRSSDDIEIDDAPAVSWGDGGAFVAAWVWVPGDEDDEDTDCGICSTCCDLRCDGCTPPDTPSLDTSAHDYEATA